MIHHIIYFIVLFLFILFLFILINQFLKIVKYETFKEKNKICCLYAYYEKNDLYKSNLEYFLKNGILENVDYYFIIN